MKTGISPRTILRIAFLFGCALTFAQTKHPKSSDHGTFGDGGPATAAEVRGPGEVVVDGNGILYVGENFRQVIRRIDLRRGVITTVPTREPLAVIKSLALDPAGNLLVIDGNRVRKVGLNDGSIQDIVAGDDRSWFGGDGGPAIAATLRSPEGMAFDRAGSLYIADTGNCRIRRVDAVTGIIQTVAGNGTRTSSGDGGAALQAGLSFPTSVAIDGAGDVYISQSG